MSQRASGYPRRPNEDYPTPRWVAAIVAEYLRCAEVREIWEPAAGNPALAEGLRAEGLEVAASAADFFRHTPPISRAGAIVTNPPYGDDRRATLACDFIRRALSFELRLVAMLLRNDFDSARTRVGLFRDEPNFVGKIVLLNRVKWFEGPKSPSDNHAWFIWDRRGRRDRPPWIAYATRADAEASARRQVEAAA